MRSPAHTVTKLTAIPMMISIANARVNSDGSFDIVPDSERVYRSVNNEIHQFELTQSCVYENIIGAGARYEPDPEWVFVDSCGHKHSYDAEFNVPSCYTTKREVIVTDDDEYETGGELLCLKCGQQIEPGVTPRRPEPTTLVLTNIEEYLTLRLVGRAEFDLAHKGQEALHIVATDQSRGKTVSGFFLMSVIKLVVTGADPITCIQLRKVG